jgi:adenylate cyclase
MSRDLFLSLIFGILYQMKKRGDYYMGKEIERKFTVDLDKIDLSECLSTKIVQGYIKKDKSSVVRVRLMDGKALLTIKGENKGIVRDEFEYEIPFSDGEEMIESLCGESIISKERFFINYESHLWELDVFSGDNKGLVVAEIELANENTKFIIPDWVEKDVSEDMRYYNNNLISNPFNSWSDTFVETFEDDEDVQILLNRIKTPDGTILTSMHRHDFINYKDTSNGQMYGVDGGLSYLRRTYDVKDYEELSVFSNSKFELIRSTVQWGTYGKDGTDVKIYKFIKDLDADHIRAIIRTQHHISSSLKDILKKELEFRKING